MSSHRHRHLYALSLAPSLAPIFLGLHSLIISMHNFRLALTLSTLLSSTPNVHRYQYRFLFASLSCLHLRGRVLPTPLPNYESQSIVIVRKQCLLPSWCASKSPTLRVLLSPLRDHSFPFDMARPSLVNVSCHPSVTSRPTSS
jgi:hypothetical protein